MIKMKRLVGSNVGFGLLRKLRLEWFLSTMRNIFVAVPLIACLKKLAGRADRVYLESLCSH